MDNSVRGSPGSGDAPSPKRARLEGGGNMPQMNQGRPGQPGQMQGNQVGPLSDVPATPDPAPIEQTRELLRQRNIDPDSIPQQQLLNAALQSTNIQAQTVEIYSTSMQQQMQAAMNNVNKANSNVNKGMPPNSGPGGAQGSPMSQPGMDAGGAGEFYAANGGRLPMPQNAAAAVQAGQAGNNNGNHALQDYQMQLMLLEQQNKKRLLMARQEQDSMTHPGGVGPNGQYAAGMSPSSGSQRGGDPSPTPIDMQRGMSRRLPQHVGVATPSPNADVGRGSPTPGMIDPNQVPQNMRSQMMIGPNGQAMMRPPSSHPMTQQQMELMRQQGIQQMPNGQFAPGQPPQGQMMPGQQSAPGGQPPMSTPRQPTNMPPPPAPQANAGGTQPSSPSQPPAPPTPIQQTAKGKPGKKETAAKKVSIKSSQSLDLQERTHLTNVKGAAAKKGAANAAPATEPEHPPTPTPVPPITPTNKNPFAQNQQLSNGAAPAAAQQLQINNAQQQQQAQQAALPQNPSAGMADLQPFGSIEADQFDMGFLDDDMLGTFDFDSLINQDGLGDAGGGLGFDANFAFDGTNDFTIEGTN